MAIPSDGGPGLDSGSSRLAAGRAGRRAAVECGKRGGEGSTGRALHRNMAWNLLDEAGSLELAEALYRAEKQRSVTGGKHDGVGSLEAELFPHFEGKGLGPFDEIRIVDMACVVGVLGGLPRRCGGGTSVAVHRHEAGPIGANLCEFLGTVFCGDVDVCGNAGAGGIGGHGGPGISRGVLHDVLDAELFHLRHEDCGAPVFVGAAREQVVELETDLTPAERPPKERRPPFAEAETELWRDGQDVSVAP